MPVEVVVTEYDPTWPGLFEQLRGRLRAALGGLATAIEHIGSTAVPSLAAKPIIDIDVLLASAADFDRARECLGKLGYQHEGDLGVAGREAFCRAPEDLPHHLYVCRPDCEEFGRHLAFRDYLRTHPEEAKAYGELKLALAAQFSEDRSAYIRGKHDFIQAMLARLEANASRLSLSIFAQQDSTVVRCKGRLTADVVGILKSQVKPLIPDAKRIVLDLSAISFMDSSGLGAVVGLYVSSKASGCDLQLVNLTKQVKSLLGMTNLLSVFETCGQYFVKLP